MNVVYVFCRLIQIKGKAKQLTLVHQRKLRSIHKLVGVMLLGVMLVGVMLVGVMLVREMLVVGARLRHRL